MTWKMTNFRYANLFMLLACLFLTGTAFYMQYILYLDPCPLCMVQRFAVYAVGLLALIAFVHCPEHRGRFSYAIGILFFSLFGAAIATRHVWLQSLPADKVPECLPGIEFILQHNPIFEAIGIILSGTGECAQTQWTFLGLSIPGWTLVAFVFFALAAAWLILDTRKTLRSSQ